MDESLKSVERTSLDRAELLKEADRPRAKPKEGKSPFDELLDESRRLGQNLNDTKGQTKSATQETLPDCEKFKERGRDRSKDHEKEEEGKKDSKGERKESGEGHKKVVGKANLKQQQGNSQGSSSGESRSGYKKGLRSQVTLKNSLLDKGSIVAGSHSFAKEFQARLAQTSPHLLKTIPQEILNQIVRTVRVGMKQDGTRLVEIECPEEVFKGLTLRFKARNGKVSLEFLTANQETRELFEKEAASLREGLQLKGITVEDLKVS